MKDHKQPKNSKEPHSKEQSSSNKPSSTTVTQEKTHSFPRNWPKKKS